MNGVLDVRVGSATGNILASQKIENDQQGGFPGFGRTKNVSLKIKTLGITGPQTIVLVYHAPEILLQIKKLLIWQNLQMLQ